MLCWTERDCDAVCGAPWVAGRLVLAGRVAALGGVGPGLPAGPEACTVLVAATTDPVEHRATVRALRLTAERALAAHLEARQLGKELRVLVQAMAPWLLALPGVGPVTAAQLLMSWSHRGRLRLEAAFAVLAGAGPIPASSGRVIRYRLNRGGDRQLNRALHTVVDDPRGWHEPTRGMRPVGPPRARPRERSGGV